MGLSVAAILLAVALVAGLLAWVRRDLRARGVSMRVWWLVLACYAFAAVAWLIAISIPLPVFLAWLATIPAAVATVIPDRLAAAFDGGANGRRRTRRSRQPAPTGRLGRAMARPVSAPHAMAHRARRQPIPSIGVLHRRPAGPSSAVPPLPTDVAAPWTVGAAPSGRHLVPAVVADPAITPRPASPEHSTRSGRHRWHPGELRLAVEMLLDAARIPDLDDAARARIDVRLDRLDRFKEPSSAELMALVRDDVHARLDIDALGSEPDPERAGQIAWFLDELDPAAGHPTTS
ncbi:MAG TPA: hypothetical protein VMT36_00260 [Candidatus Saccharimonadia bacterium]|nr:hypothetical protein [Candidatus Saccharimonadia bacterium]